MCGQVHKYSDFYLDLYLSIPDLDLNLGLAAILPVVSESAN